MGILVDGRWQTTDELPKDDAGAFVRPSSAFRARVTADGAGPYPAARGRYHLFAALGCPWAHRDALYRRLKGLEDVVSVSLSPEMGDDGWWFSEGVEGAKSDELAPVSGRLALHRVYTAANPTFTGRVTVPVLWDKQTGTIVNNESSEIIRMFDAAFDDLGARGPRYYPPELAGEIDALNARVYEKLNNGVYRAGFARAQEAYEAAARGVFEMLDELVARLDHGRYLLGDRVTEADLPLLTTLVRFDVGYYTLFKCNLRRLEEYPNLSGYARDLCQLPGVMETVQPDVYKRGYHAIRLVNPFCIVPIGPPVDFARPHDRATRAYR